MLLNEAQHQRENTSNLKVEVRELKRQVAVQAAQLHTAESQLAEMRHENERLSAMLSTLMDGEPAIAKR